MEDLTKLAEEELVLKLNELLKERRYLVVLDDIWETEVWDSIQSAFPSGKMGSKVMLTTRNKEVALYADAMSEPIEPRFLTQDESLELFRKKAFPGMDHMPCDLEKLGREMMVKCDGLPLAVMVLGGLLSMKRKTAEEWRRVLENIDWHLLDAQDRVGTLTSLGSLKAIRMHGVLRDFSISKGKEESFLEIYSGRKIESPTSQKAKSRRLAIHGEHDLQDFKLLRVLDGVPMPSRALSAVGNLIQLRYLGVLMRTDMEKIELTRSIGKLKNL
ncbi:unnamed protein product [Prunus armeniaca]